MKIALIYSILFGMLLMFIPRTLVHDCDHHDHSCESHEDHEEENKELSFNSEDCDLCTYAFHALDIPTTDLIRLPDVPFSFESSIKLFSIALPSTEGILLRGPPNSFSLS